MAVAYYELRTVFEQRARGSVDATCTVLRHECNSATDCEANALSKSNLSTAQVCALSKSGRNLHLLQRDISEIAQKRHSMCGESNVSTVQVRTYLTLERREFRASFFELRLEQRLVGAEANRLLFALAVQVRLRECD